MWRFLRDVFLPPTDFLVFLQVAIVTPLWLLVMFLVRRNRDVLWLVFGLGMVGAALTVARAIH